MAIEGTRTKHRALRSAFTMVEIAVVVSVIGILAALLLPAVQGAREASRRAACAANLRQLALAAHGYVAAQGVLPMGTPIYDYPEIGVHAGHSVFVAILGELDQAPLLNSVNFSHNIYRAVNQTVQSTTLGLLHCPSDPTVARATPHQGSYQDMPPGRFAPAYSSYAACAGTWYHLDRDLAYLKRLASRDDGLAFANSAVRLADVRDGLSQTLLMGERAHGRLPDRLDFLCGWWFDGYFADTLFWTLFPMNSRMEGRSDGPPMERAGTDPRSSSAGSLHPGGAHVAFADGSVKFIKDSIDSWPIDPARRMPVGVFGDPHAEYVIRPGVRRGVYQALSTRAGAEAVEPGEF